MDAITGTLNLALLLLNISIKRISKWTFQRKANVNIFKSLLGSVQKYMNTYQWRSKNPSDFVQPNIYTSLIRYKIEFSLRYSKWLYSRSKQNYRQNVSQNFTFCSRVFSLHGFEVRNSHLQNVSFLHLRIARSLKKSNKHDLAQKLRRPCKHDQGEVWQIYINPALPD